jgi:hypothetical protein
MLDKVRIYKKTKNNATTEPFENTIKLEKITIN